MDSKWNGIFPATVDDFHAYRRRLPHWRLTGSMYWVTWRLHSSRAELPEAARDIVVETLRHFDGERYDLFAYVVMDDHVHVLVQPRESYELQKLVQVWKSFSAWRIIKELGWYGTVWQDEYWDRIVRNEEELYEKTSYIMNNPRKRWPEIDSYEWVYCVLLSGKTESWADTKVRPTPPSELPY